MNSSLQNRPPVAPETFPGIFWCPDLISIRDLGPQGVEAVLHLAELMKARPSVFQRALAGKQMAMFFEKLEKQSGPGGPQYRGGPDHGGSPHDSNAQYRGSSSHGGSERGNSAHEGQREHERK